MFIFLFYQETKNRKAKSIFFLGVKKPALFNLYNLLKLFIWFMCSERGGIYLGGKVQQSLFLYLRLLANGPMSVSSKFLEKEIWSKQ